MQIINRSNTRRRMARRTRSLQRRSPVYDVELRQKPDSVLVLDLPDTVANLLGKGTSNGRGLGKGARVWFFVDGCHLHMTAQPWGPYRGRRLTSRVRTTHRPLKQQLDLSRQIFKAQLARKTLGKAVRQAAS